MKKWSTKTKFLFIGETSPEGYFLVIGFFRTRLALWHWASVSVMNYSR